MKVSLIAAAAENGVIGSKNAMIWHIREDLARFRRTTMGHHVVLGRRSYESLGRPLEGRTLIVLSRQRGYDVRGTGDSGAAAGRGRAAGTGRAEIPERSVFVVHSDGEALALARRRGEEELFVAGGEEIYRLFLPAADRIYLTRLHAVYQGDAFFPALGPEWREVCRREDRSAGPVPISFLLYTRSSRPDGDTHGSRPGRPAADAERPTAEGD